MKRNYIFIKKNIPYSPLNAYKLRGTNFFKNMQNDNDSILAKACSSIKEEYDFKCILCGKKKGLGKLDWKQGYKLIECLNCHAVSANIDTEDSEKHIEKIYSNETDNYQYVLNSVAKTYEYRKSLFGKERYKYCVERLELDKVNPRILDLGCGVGYFLSYLKDLGINGRGLEVDPSQSKYCKENGLNVDVTGIEEESDNFYDLIVMFDVLEHLVNPIDIMSTIRNKLSKDGYIVAYTPNLHSFSFELMGSQQNLLRPFQHVCFYNEASLEYLAKCVGLRIEKIDYFGLDVMDYLLKKEYEDKYDYTEKLQDFITLAQGCIDKLEISNHMRITFKKSN